MRCGKFLIALALLAAPGAFAQDTKAWLESEGLEAVDTKAFAEFEAVVAYTRHGGRRAARRDPREGQARVADRTRRKRTRVRKWTIVSIGRDLEGKGQPDVHFSSNTGGANCCTTHYVYSLKPQVKRLAVYSAGSMGGGDFIEVPGRKAAGDGLRRRFVGQRIRARTRTRTSRS